MFPSVRYARMSSQLIVCRNTESAVIKVKASEAWALIRRLNFVDIMPSIVKRCSLLIPLGAGTSSPGPTSPRSKSSTVKLEEVEYQDLPLGNGSGNPFACAVAVGSLRHVVYKDSAEFVFRVVEISDVLRQISYELIETDATINVSSIMHTIQLFEVTETGETMINWTTDFSGDCDQHVYSDCKYKKLDAFKDIRKNFEKPSAKNT